MKKIILIVGLLTIFLNQTYADNLEIVDVKRNIPLAESDPIYKDYYIKGSSGLKKNLIVKAVRKIEVKDASLKSIGHFKTTVGLVKIIETSDSVAIAREYKLLPRADEPMVEQIGIMVGDEIDLAGSYTEEKK